MCGGGRVSAAVKNSPIKKISFLRGNEGWRAINVRRENDLWQAERGEVTRPVGGVVELIIN